MHLHQPLTSRQAEVYKVIADHMRDKKVPPVLADLLEKLGISRPQGVRVHISALVRKGWAGRIPGKAGGLYLTPPDGSCPYCGAGGSGDGGSQGERRGPV